MFRCHRHGLGSGDTPFAAREAGDEREALCAWPDQAVTLPAILERPTPRRTVDLDDVPEEEMAAFASSIVDRQGRVRWVEVESSARPEVLLGFVDTACRWVYRPGTLGGEPATMRVQTNLFLAPPAE